MDRIPSDEALTETIKTLIISRKSPMTVTQLKQDYQELEGKTIPDAKLHSLMKYNAVFHHIQPYNGNAEERFDVRFDVRARMMSRQKSQKKFIPATMKNPVVPRNRYTVTINNNNVGQNDFNGDGPQPLMDLRQKLNRKDPPAPMPKLTMPLSERLKKRGQLSPEDIQAANAVKISELNQNPLDVSSDGEIVKKVWLMIRNSIGGVFVKHITSLFNETYKLSLPENWQQLVKQHESVLFNFETNAFNELIIFAIGDIDMTSSRPVEIGSSQQIAELIFPWELSLWNVFVTGVISTNDVSARLIGANYSDALDKLLNDIEIFMLTNKERPQEILLHHVYLTSIAECYHRIRVVEMSGESANCICIDNGDYEWIRFEDIYLCKPEFLVVAPQAFKLSLFGLEAFENDPNVAQQPLFEPLVFKSLIAEVMQDRKAYEFTKNKPIPSIVYDTSTEEDVNLNESLMNSILRSIPTPALHQKDNNQVLITKIGDDGIYCQLVKSAVHLQNQINNIPKDDLSKHRGMYTDKADKKKNYLAYDPKKKTWFRARLERYTEGDSQLMNFVDHGFKATVKVSDLYRLDKLSIVLFSYPAQVLKFGLFNVQMTGDVKKRLLALLPSGTQALLKVVTTGAGNLPLVHLFTYINHNEDAIMIKINDQFATTLGTDLESFSPNDPLIQLESRKLKSNGEFIKIHVNLVSSPQCFVFQLQDDIDGLASMTSELQSFCNSSGKLSSLSDVKKGECYAIYDDEARKWVRASAENVIDADFIHCLEFDSGNFKTMSIDKMRPLPNQFRKMPKLAMKGKLFGVKPKHKDFTPDDAIHFKMLTEGKSFPAVVKKIASDVFDQEPLFEIVIFGKDEKIHETLIREDRALPI